MWSLVLQSEQRATNRQSIATGQLCALFWGYIRGKSEQPESIPSYSATDFLPFQFNKKCNIDQETAKIIVEALKSNNVPSSVVHSLVAYDLYEEIVTLGGGINE